MANSKHSNSSTPLMYRDIDSIIVLPERNGKKIFLVILAMIFAALVSGIAVYTWQMQEIGLISADYRTQIANLKDEQKVSEKQTRNLELQLGAVKLLAKSPEQAEVVSRVASLTTVPSEVPAITTITDISKFSGQPLYVNAKNGDKIVFFSKAGITIIYRSSENSIVAQS